MSDELEGIFSEEEMAELQKVERKETTMVVVPVAVTLAELTDIARKLAEGEKTGNLDDLLGAYVAIGQDVFEALCDRAARGGYCPLHGSFDPCPDEDDDLDTDV